MGTGNNQGVWSRGDDYAPNTIRPGDLYIAGIHLGDHGNAVECYGDTAEIAASRRDELLDALQFLGSFGGRDSSDHEVDLDAIARLDTDQSVAVPDDDKTATALCEDEGCPQHGSVRVGDALKRLDAAIAKFEVEKS